MVRQLPAVSLMCWMASLRRLPLTKLLDGVLTTTELNIVDGGTSATGATASQADRMVVNDAGTMVQVALSDLVTFLEDGATSGFDIDGMHVLMALLSAQQGTSYLPQGISQGLAHASQYVGRRPVYADRRQLLLKLVREAVTVRRLSICILMEQALKR